jgi:hypothetical protein
MAGRGRRQARLGEGPFGKHEARCGKCAAGENVPAGWKSLVIVHHGILSCFFRPHAVMALQAACQIFGLHARLTLQIPSVKMPQKAAPNTRPMCLAGGRFQ